MRGQPIGPPRSDRELPLGTAGARCLWHAGGTAAGFAPPCRDGETVGHDRSQRWDEGALARPGGGRHRDGQLSGRRRPRDPYRPAPQLAHRHPGRPRRRSRAHRGHLRWAGWSGRLAGGTLADDPHRRRTLAVGGYTTTAVLSSLIGAATTVWRVGVLRAGAWAARGLRVPARNALLADIVPATVYGRAYGFERAMDNLGAIAGPLFALVLVGLVGTRTAIALSITPGLLAALAIVYAIRHAPAPSGVSGSRCGCGSADPGWAAGPADGRCVGVRVRECGCHPVDPARHRAAGSRPQPGPSPSSPSGCMSPTTWPPRWRASRRAGSGTTGAPSWSCSWAWGCWAGLRWPRPAVEAFLLWRRGSLLPGWRSGVWRRPSTPLWPPSPSSCADRRSAC